MSDIKEFTPILTTTSSEMKIINANCMTIKNVKGTIIVDYFRDQDVYTFKKTIDKSDIVSIEVEANCFWVSLYDGKEYYPIFIVAFDKFISYELDVG